LERGVLPFCSFAILPFRSSPQTIVLHVASHLLFRSSPQTIVLHVAMIFHFEKPKYNITLFFYVATNTLNIGHVEGI